jgi:outer membrane protein
MAAKLRTQQETFQRDAPVMGAEEKANLERQLRDGARDFERLRNQLGEDFNLRQNEEIANLRRDAVVRAQTYAREQKFDLLLLDQTVVFASTAVDITEAVIGKPAAPAAAPAR